MLPGVQLSPPRVTEPPISAGVAVTEVPADQQIRSLAADQRALAAVVGAGQVGAGADQSVVAGAAVEQVGVAVVAGLDHVAARAAVQQSPPAPPLIRTGTSAGTFGSTWTVSPPPSVAIRIEWTPSGQWTCPPPAASQP